MYFILISEKKSYYYYYCEIDFNPVAQPWKRSTPVCLNTLSLFPCFSLHNIHPCTHSVSFFFLCGW